MAEEKKRLFTGLQASGQMHIGNYFGAIKPNVDLFTENQGLFMVADYHALTSLKDAASLRSNIIGNVKDYLAAGLNLDNAILFKQSDVSEHTELGWIFDCLVTVPFLMQGHAYKDKVAKGLEPNAGLFTYPMLMAADILLYDTDIVPVGEDQRQHVEYAREAAAKFNIAYGQTFKEPQESISKTVGVVPGTDGKKMSKSYGNTIPLFGTKDEIAKAVMSIVTDSGPESDFKTLVHNMQETGALESYGTFYQPLHVYRIHRLIKTEEELVPVYEANKGSYKALKEALIEDLDAFIAPMRDKRASISDEDVKDVLKKGGERAKELAAAKMAEVRKKVGVTL